MKTKISSSVDETKNFAKNIAMDLKTPQLIALYGNLGSGKTTFVQGLALGLGIKKRVLSPTFVFVREYQLDNKKMFFHVDLYRLDSSQDIATIGLSDILKTKNAIIAIEWPEKIEKLLPASTIKINFDTTGEKSRKIVVLNSAN